jgi:hypothetical protein
MSTCNRLDLESLGSWPTMPKTSWTLPCTAKKSSSLKYSRGPFYGPQDVVPTVYEGILRIFYFKVNLKV